ncbi:hypothetical protein EZV62_011435 [Acer yangbiense]|uniref:TF-B3 domain-containing protein n=1 Tax=Acer yangbiense TaxID=1000413 RepID=A0A5C7I5C2_9ROSI|nr:hypothetical protein EZV62_011435 [Acer yangbiense]
MNSRRQMVKSSNKRFPDFFKVYLPARSSHRLCSATDDAVVQLLQETVAKIDLVKCSEHLHVPDAFVAHCGKLLPKKAVLSNHMGNFWHVDVVNTENGVHFLNGWHKFVQDNSLQKEQSPEKEWWNLWSVNFDSEGSKKMVIVKEGGSKQNHNVVVAEAAAINEGKAFDVSNFVQPRNPHFIAKLRTKTKKNLLHVPSKVLERHNLDLPDLMIFQNEQGRQWPVQAFRWNDGRMWISGWKDFCKYNHVGVDDSCICEFLPGRDGKKGDIIQRIPEKFVKKFRDELSAFATITTPDGRVWQVGLLKDGGKIWFHHGLQDFIEYYSICVGYFLVFEYEKRSKFHVIILDTSTFEISYPYNFEEPKKEENLIHKKEDYRNQQGASNLDRSSNKCKMKEQVEVNTNTTHDGEDEHPTPIKDVQKLRALLEDKGIFLSIKYNFSSVKERKRLFNLARSLKPRNPSFMIMFRPSHLYSRVVYLPAKFANKYLTHDTERIKLRASNGRKWPVQICWKRGGCNTQEGWTEFQDGMKLKAGDICLFELIRTEDLLLEVSVFKS